MANCSTCHRTMPDGAAFCEHCGTPGDATNIAPGGYDATYGSSSPSGDAPTNVGTPYAAPGNAYASASGSQQGSPHGYDQSGYGGGQGYDRGYDQSGYDQSGYGAGGYGGGYGGYGGDPGGSGSGGGKGVWIAVWSAVAALVIAVLVVTVYLTVLRDDGDKEADGGGDETTTEDTEPEFQLNSYNDIALVDGVATLEFEASRGDIVVLASDQEDLSPPEADLDRSDYAIYLYWEDGEGIAGWDVGSRGTQTVEFTYEGSEELDSVSIYVNVVDGDGIQPGDEVEIVETVDGDDAPVGAAIVEDMDGDYGVDADMYATTLNDGNWQCNDTLRCNATGTGFLLVTEPGLSFEPVATSP